LLNLDSVLFDQGFAGIKFGSDFKLHAANIRVIGTNIFGAGAEKQRAGGIVSFFGQN